MAERISVGCGEAVSRASLRNFQITLPHHQVRKAQPDDRETHHGVSVTLVCSAVPWAGPYALNGCRLVDRLWRIFFVWGSLHIPYVTPCSAIFVACWRETWKHWYVPRSHGLNLTH